MKNTYKKWFGIVAASVLLSACGNDNTQPSMDQQESQESIMDNPQVKIVTNYGEIIVELDAEKAPVTTENFIAYVNDGFYEETLFHRVIPEFMIQGGGFTADFEQKETKDSIQNEADNGLRNKRGTIAMARTPDPHSATAQFFINLVDNNFLDYQEPTERGWGYAVFGEVVDGMDIVDQIAQQPTISRNGHQDVPQDAIVIETIEIVS